MRRTLRTLAGGALSGLLLACAAASFADDVGLTPRQPGGAAAVRRGGAKREYHEAYRPQFHFSSRTNWINDPNGMVSYKGEYHLFFQHNPLGLNWGNMTWGHAASRDLFHWRQLDDAIKPDKLGTIFSGSAVVDWKNTAGFQQGNEKPIVCIYTSAGGTSDESRGQPFTQSISYSNDRGRTFSKFRQNPVLKHVAGENRDPKVIWHKPTRKWIMALYLDGSTYGLFSSPDLKQWTRLSEVVVPGTAECPDFFPLAVDGNAANTKWVFWGANNNYLVGTFDGTSFKREAGPFSAASGNRYAAQTLSDVADGRRIQIAWMRGGEYPGMPFNQQMSLPVELALRTFPDGVRLCMQPVVEVDSLHKTKWSFSGPIKSDKIESPKGDSDELLDIQLKMEAAGAASLTMDLFGALVAYDFKSKRLSVGGASAVVEPVDGCVGLRAFVDRTSIEVFSADGRANVSYCFLPKKNTTWRLRSVGGEITIRSLNVWELASIWPE